MPQLLPPQHVRNVQKAQASANDALLHIEALRDIAAVMPDVQPVYEELKNRHTLLNDSANAVLRVHRRLSSDRVNVDA